MWSLRLKGVVPKFDGFNPSRLRLARIRRGLTKRALAERVGIEWRTVSGYEAGEYLPSRDVLARLASTLEFPKAFFEGDDLDVPQVDAASFRAMSRMTAAKRDMALGEGALALMFNSWLEQRFELPPADIPDLSKEPSPEVAAITLRTHWMRGEQPIKNMIHLLESKGVRVFSLAIDSRNVDAFSMWKDKTPFVFLNTYKSAEHSRYDAAHELGHLVLHRHAPHGREAEKQANEFAAAFLMPLASVLAHARRFPTFDMLVKQKKIWNISVAALAYRLHSLQMLSDWQYRSLCIEISKRGRGREPDPSPSETSQMLAKALDQLRSDGITRAQIANDLCITVAELDQLMFGLVMTAMKGGRPSNSPSPQPKAKLMLVK